MWKYFSLIRQSWMKHNTRQELTALSTTAESDKEKKNWMKINFESGDKSSWLLLCNAVELLKKSQLKTMISQYFFFLGPSTQWTSFSLLLSLLPLNLNFQVHYKIYVFLIYSLTILCNARELLSRFAVAPYQTDRAMQSYLFFFSSNRIHSVLVTYFYFSFQYPPTLLFSIVEIDSIGIKIGLILNIPNCLQKKKQENINSVQRK